MSDIIIPISVAIINIIGAVLVIPVSNFIERKKLKTLISSDEVNLLLNKSDDNYINTFLIPDIRERKFEMQTGISVNEESIPKLVNLKKKLGEGYGWEIIKKSKSFFDFNKEEITIKLSNRLKILCLRIKLASFPILIGNGFPKKRRFSVTITAYLFATYRFA